MLNRHFIRAKVLQNLYAYSITEDSNLPKAEQALLNNINKLYDLFIYQLSTLTETISFAEKNSEEVKQKFFPTEEEKNPNLRFIQNEVIQKLANNSQFLKACERMKINWAQESNIFRTVYNNFKTQQAYKNYMELPNATHADDCQIAALLFKELMNYEPLEALFEEKNLFWEDDFFQMAQMGYKFVKEFPADFDEFSSLPQFFESKDGGNDDDKEFLVDLMRKTILHNDEYDELIKKRIQNWDIERIAFMDMLILKMAITEFIYMPSIPVKVTINEYVELAKEYSTGKSKIFVNGVLDRLCIDLREEGKLKKMGRGLINQSKSENE